MVNYDPAAIAMELIKENWAIGRNNTSAPCKDGRRPSNIDDWEENPDKPLPSLEFENSTGSFNILSLDAATRYLKDEVRIVVRSKRKEEAKLMTLHLCDIGIEQCKAFTSLSKFPNMNYNFLETLSTFKVNEYADDVTFWRIDVLFVFHAPKKFTLG